MFPQNIVELRSEKGWSQRELGRQAGVTGRCIGLIEAGKRRMYLDTAVKIAKALDVTVDELIKPVGEQ